MTQHTDGPWERLNGDEIGATTQYRRTSIIAKLDVSSGPQGDRPSKSEREANARLIAAAPDLLEALEMVFADAQANNADLSDTTGHVVRAALAKVRDHD